MHLSKFKPRFDRVKKRISEISHKDLKILLPTFYILSILTGFIIAGFYPFFPELTYCGKLFGESFCTPLGFFFAMFVSLPGYMIAGNILKFFPNVPIVGSVLLVLISSYIFYYLVGRLIESLKNKKKTKDDKIRMLILVFFFVLAFLALSLA